MTNLEIGVAGVAAALTMIALRVPIGISLGLVSTLGVAAMLNPQVAWGLLSATPFDFVGDWSLTAAPMFLLMGYIATATGLTNGLFTAMRIFLSRLPGGLAVASVAACTLFAAASGSSVATAAAMARIATPEMLRHNYDRGLATGVIAASGTLGSLIPPSVLLVLYGVYAQVSVGQLFMAGVLPGIVSALLYAGMIVGRCMVTPALAGRVDETFTRDQKLDALRDIWPLPVLVASVIGGIFFGVFSPTEAGALGAAVAFLIALVRGKVSRAAIGEALSSTAISAAGIFIILIGSVLFTRFLALSGVPAAFTDLVLGVSQSPLWILFAVVVIYLVLGMFIDSIGLLLLTLPMILPLVDAAGMNLIWFGIVVIKLLEIGLVTPPVGLNVYVIKGALGDQVTLYEVFRGVAWFIAMDVAALALIVAIPALALWLPALMYV